MKFDAFVAKRYLTARRKQAFIFVISLITLLGITVGTAALNIALSLHNGLRNAFMHSLVGETGSLQIVAGSMLENGFDEFQLTDVLKVLAETPGVKNTAIIRQEPGVAISNRKRLQYVNIYGILPEQYRAATDRLDKITAGDPAGLVPRDNPPFGIMLGEDLARSLGVGEGNTLKIAVPRISSPGLSRSGFKFRELKCVVVGTFKTGNSQFDERDAYLHLHTLYMLLNSTKASSVLVQFDSMAALDVAKNQLIGHPGLPISSTVVDFRDLNESLLQALDLEKLGTTVLISLFILVVALNMISALIMLVMEKNRDIGIMRSFGAPAALIRRIFIRQGMTLALWGTLLGSLIGMTTALVLDHFQLIKVDNDVYEVINYVPFEIHALEVALVAVGSMLVSFIATLFPARQAARLDPVEALKYD